MTKTPLTPNIPGSRDDRNTLVTTPPTTPPWDLTVIMARLTGQLGPPPEEDEDDD